MGEFRMHYKIPREWRTSWWSLHLLKLIYILGIVGIVLLLYFTDTLSYPTTGLSSVVIKVRGAVLSDDAILDPVDYVYSHETNAFLITTRMATTVQTQGTCPDNDANSGCRDDSMCVPDQITKNGIMNGKCNIEKGMCLIRGWCPVENLLSSSTTVNYIKNADQFTVYIKDREEFIRFNISVSNNYRAIQSSYKCSYNAETDPNCPIFTIAYILNKTEVIFQDLMEEGGIFQIYIKWKCHFNCASDPCQPNYEFRRISKDYFGKFLGYRIRYATYSFNGEKRFRSLISINGLRFLILIKSTGKKFEYFNFIWKLCSYGSVLSLVTFMIWCITQLIFCCMDVPPTDDYESEDEKVKKEVKKANDEDDSKKPLVT